jgi:hypothetical protein
MAKAVARRRRSPRSAGSCASAWRFCERADPQAKGAVERLQGYAETNFEPGRRFVNELDFQDQLDGWFAKVNTRTHKTLRARPVDRLAGELAVMAPLPREIPDCDRRWVARVPPDPHLRVDIPTTTASTLRSSTGASRSSSASGQSSRSRSTLASWPTGTRASSRGNG